MTQQRFGIFPANAGVSDALAEYKWFAQFDILPAGYQMAFDHDPKDAMFPRLDLSGYIMADCNLALVLFLAVGMREVNH